MEGKSLDIGAVKLKIRSLVAPGIEAGDIDIVTDVETDSPSTVWRIPTHILTSEPEGPPYVVLISRDIIRRSLAEGSDECETTKACHWGSFSRETVKHFHTHGQEESSRHREDLPFESCPIGKQATLFGRADAISLFEFDRNLYNGEEWIDKQRRVLDQRKASRVYLGKAFASIGGYLAIRNEEVFAHAGDATEHLFDEKDKTFFRRPNDARKKLYKEPFDFADS